MSPRAYDRDRLAKLLELAGHPSSNETEALNALRAARSLLDRAGASLAALTAGAAGKGGQADAAPTLRAQLEKLERENEDLRAEAARLKRANARLRALNAELEAGASEAGSASQPVGPAGDVRVTPALVEIYALLSEWRSIPDLVERLGAAMGAARVKRLVRVLDDHDLLRIVEAWPVRYRLRAEGELGERAKALRTRIEDALASATAERA